MISLCDRTRIHFCVDFVFNFAPNLYATSRANWVHNLAQCAGQRWPARTESLAPHNPKIRRNANWETNQCPQAELTSARRDWRKTRIAAAIIPGRAPGTVTTPYGNGSCRLHLRTDLSNGLTPHNKRQNEAKQPIATPTHPIDTIHERNPDQK